MFRQLRKKGLVQVVILLLLIFGSSIVAAQDFPVKPVTVVVPLGAGGSNDLTARAVGSVAADYLGQPIIVKLKPGGGGAIGSDYVSKAAPDGYTLLMGGPAMNTTLPAVMGRSKGPDDLAMVCRINYSPILIVCKPDAPYKTFKEMIAYAKANPNKIVFGNGGPWGPSDLPWKLIMEKTGITTKVVPHNGGGPCLIALLGGHIDVAGQFAISIQPHIKAGKVRALAILDNKRHPNFPDVPTAIEEGVDVTYLMWRGLMAPKDTPQPIIQKLATAFKGMTEDKTVKRMIQKFGDDLHYMGPEAFTKLWREEYIAHKELRKFIKK